ncbi:hypothetical protein [Mycobacterium sp. shizuoka-1]|uniref:hypothetical protein n=1 Tax=Mycobacterium sp. shizuoka-1 TaxID=2039281 RepID=UPI001E3B3463|nr:hypothetical protein [Mycobacterium sp. shizuoka-1]
MELTGLGPALRALLAFAGADEVDDDVADGEGPFDDPVSADATAAPATMAAPTPRVTAPAFNHIRAPRGGRASTPFRGFVSFAHVIIGLPPARIFAATFAG